MSTNMQPERFSTSVSTASANTMGETRKPAISMPACSKQVRMLRFSNELATMFRKCPSIWLPMTPTGLVRIWLSTLYSCGTTSSKSMFR